MFLVLGMRDLEAGLKLSASTSCLYELQPPPSPTTPTLVLSNSGKTLLVSNSSKSLVLSNSGKRFDKKKYVKQVTGRHNDTELHLAAQRGDLTAVRQILGEIDAQMVGTLSGADFDAEVAEIRSAIVNEVNELGETALFTAAEKGHLDIVKELLQYSTKEGMKLKNRSGFDPFHIAASQGHEGILLVLLFFCFGLFCYSKFVLDDKFCCVYLLLNEFSWPNLVGKMLIHELVPFQQS